jgi:hypothetical protein
LWKRVKGKNKVVLMRAMTLCRRSGGTTPLILNLDTRGMWLVSVTPRLLPLRLGVPSTR